MINSNAWLGHMPYTTTFTSDSSPEYISNHTCWIMYEFVESIAY